MDGCGTIGSTTSGAIGEQRRQLGGALRGRDRRLTSPEELIAAAHAACFSMALSAGLAKAGTPPERAPAPRRPSRSSPARASRRSRSPSRAASPASTRRVRGGRAGREGELPGLEGARRRPRDHARGARSRLDRLDLPALDVVDEAGRRERVGQQRTSSRIVATLSPHALGRRPGTAGSRSHSDSGPSFACRSAFCEREHAAVGVPDHDRLLRPEQVVRDDRASGASRR